MICMDNIPFPERLSFCMRQAGLSGAGLSSLTGITAASISRYLNGLRSPTVQNIVQIAQVLCVSSDYLLGLSDSPEGEKQRDDICKN